MENLLKDLTKQVKYLKEANKNIKNINKDYEKLEKYYLTEWIDDYTNFKWKKEFYVLNQDSINDVLNEIHLEKIKLLKQIASKLI